MMRTGLVAALAVVAALPALGQMTAPAADVKPLVKALDSEDWRVRQEAAESLGELGTKAAAAIPALAARATQDDDINVRAAAVLALIEVGREDPTRIIPTLIVAVEDDFSAIRVDAVDALGDIGPAAKEAAATLIRMMDAPPHGASSPDFWRALDKIGVELPTLVGLMNGEAENAGRYAMEAMAKRGAEVLPDLTRILDTGSDVGKERAAQAMGAMGPAAKDGIPALARALAGEDAPVRGAAAAALGRIGPAARPAVGALLERAKADSSRRVRESAIVALGQIAQEADGATAALAGCLRDEDSGVRQAAAEVLGTLGGEPAVAVPALIRSLQDESWYVRASVFEALGKFGPEAKAAIPEMLRIIRTPFPYKEYGFTARESFYQTAEEAAAADTSDARRSAILALGKIAPDSEKVFAAVLKTAAQAEEHDSDIRPWALQALADFGKMTREKATGVLFRALRDEGPYRVTIRAEAVTTLGEVGASDPDVIRYVLKMEPVGAVGVGIMEKLGPSDKAVIPDLIAAIKAKSPGVPESSRPVPMAAIAGLTAIGESAAADLAKVLDEGDSWTAYCAAEAIAGMGAGARPAVPALVRALGSQDYWTSRYAAKALTRLGPHASDAMPDLLEIIREKKAGRTQAIRVIGALKTDADTVLSVLVGIAEDTEEDAADRTWAIASLAYMGEDAKEALPVLRTLAGDGEVGRHAAAAVRHLEGVKSE